MLSLGQAAQAVLDDDHRPVDDQAEVEGFRLIRLPETPSVFIPIPVIKNEIGMISTAMSAARTLPSRKNSAIATSTAPSNRLR